MFPGAGMDFSLYFTLDLTSSERRVLPQWTVAYLKDRIEKFTGIEPKFQVLKHFPVSTSSESVEIVNSATDPETMVASLKLEPYSRVHVVDTNPNKVEYDEVEEFKMSDEAYEKRPDSVLQWKKKNQLGRFDPKYRKETSANVGDRCRVLSIDAERRGTVRYVGEIPQLEKDTVWVGVEFDEPVGKNDGSFGDSRYFQCTPKHGSFLRAERVEVGDFPELSYSDEEEL